MSCSILESKYIRITYKVVLRLLTSFEPPDGLVSDFTLSGYLWHNWTEIVWRENAWVKQAEEGIPRRTAATETRDGIVTIILRYRVYENC
jgi:hypothetical protein